MALACPFATVPVAHKGIIEFGKLRSENRETSIGTDYWIRPDQRDIDPNL